MAKRPVGVPSGYGRGQTGLIGVVLLLAITIIGTTAIVTFGSTAISETQANSQSLQAENAMTLLDARAATAALGESSVQTVRLGSADGTYAIDPDAGRIRVTHLNFTNDGTNETVYEASLGAVTYTAGDETIAYQGGGVWRAADNGSTMLSTPEFHFRKSTLTLPLIRVNGSGAASTGAIAVVRSNEQPRQIYPNLTAPATGGTSEVGAPYNGTDNPYHNPVRNGTVRITVESEYYEGWATYFRTRTDGNVTVNDTAESVSVDLETVGGDGRFQMPAEGDEISLGGLASGHAITDFTLNLEPPENNGGNIPRTGFNNMDWSLYAQEGNQEFEIHLSSTGKQDCKNSQFNDLQLGIYYSNETGAPHEWQNTAIDPQAGDTRVECTDLDDDGQDEPQIVLDLTGSTTMSFEETTLSDWHFDQSDTAATTAPFDEHTDDGEPTTFTKGSSTTSVDYLTNHYIALMAPSVDLVVDDNSAGGGNRISESQSFGDLQYERGEARFITFLHISTTEVVVEFD